ncbi:MAG: hypothetical protein WBV76_20325 [Pseudolabrys sp.]
MEGGISPQGTDFRPDIVFFPDPAEIAPHAIAFARMMFAHTAFERRGVAGLQDAITRQPGFGEQRANQWGTRRRPKLMVELIETERGKGFPQTDEIAKLLTDAIDSCEQRNLLAHGEWWGFDRPTAAIIVRSGTRWEHPEIPPEHRRYTASNIEAVAAKLKDIEVELSKLIRAINEDRHAELGR